MLILQKAGFPSLLRRLRASLRGSAIFRPVRGTTALARAGMPCVTCDTRTLREGRTLQLSHSWERDHGDGQVSGAAEGKKDLPAALFPLDVNLSFLFDSSFLSSKGHSESTRRVRDLPSSVAHSFSDFPFSMWPQQSHKRIEGAGRACD